MLGDSENPAHTQWQKDSSNFKGQYVYGKAVIEYVAESVGELMAIVNRRNEAADPSLTIDFFSISPPDDDDKSDDGLIRKPRPKKGSESPEDELEINGRPTRIRVSRTAGGFTVLPGVAPPVPPFAIEVRCAYETRNGNPLKKWNVADFTVGQGGLPVMCEGAVAVAAAKQNVVLLRVDGSDFRAQVEGFDVNRDLYVRYDVRELGNASAEA